jgi:hypothetical protein
VISQQFGKLEALSQFFTGKLEALCQFVSGGEQREPAAHGAPLSSLRWTVTGFIGILRAQLDGPEGIMVLAGQREGFSHFSP